MNKLLLATLICVKAVVTEPQVTSSGLKVEHISKPDTCDRVARNGDSCTIHYIGTLEDGKSLIQPTTEAKHSSFRLE